MKAAAATAVVREADEENNNKKGRATPECEMRDQRQWQDNFFFKKGKNSSRNSQQQKKKNGKLHGGCGGVWCGCGWARGGIRNFSFVPDKHTRQRTVTSVRTKNRPKTGVQIKKTLLLVVLLPLLLLLYCQAFSTQCVHILYYIFHMKENEDEDEEEGAQHSSSGGGGELMGFVVVDRFFFE